MVAFGSRSHLKRRLCQARLADDRARWRANLAMLAAAREPFRRLDRDTGVLR
jgi:hypothetical protein